jgi:CRISPR/Cas system CSM-associated protein Csm3 (group 7 of RAMP superfamily)
MNDIFRWRIEGTLTARTPLHIGSGETTERGDLKVAEGDKKAGEKDKKVEIAAVAVDHEEHPYLPGSVLKGNVRAWLAVRGVRAELMDAVFGSEAQGGKAEFWDAPLAEPLSPRHPPPYWDGEHQTGVMPGVTLDRMAGAARHERLFYQEFVPPETAFRITITGLQLTEDEVALLLAGLEGFNAALPVTLGAGTPDGMGRFTWALSSVRGMDASALAAWLVSPTLPMAEGALPELPRAVSERLRQMAAVRLGSCLPGPVLRARLAIHCYAPFVVNDPSVKQKNDEAPAYNPRTDHKDQVILPASSLRGALRAQAERILRTLDGRACYVDDSASACKPIQQAEEKEELCLACQVFGAPGWRTPLTLSDFTRVSGTGHELTQEFVAIDRFTGGAAHQKKFEARVIHAASFTGEVGIEFTRLEPWALGLLALLMRDWMEGDITLGYGAAKGYGSCRVEIREWWVQGGREVDGLSFSCPSAPQAWADTLRHAERSYLNGLVAAFRERVRKNG